MYSKVIQYLLGWFSHKILLYICVLYSRSLFTCFINDGGGLVTRSCSILVVPLTVAHQCSLSLGFPRQEYRNGLPLPSPVDLSYPGSYLHCRPILYRLSHQGNLKNAPKRRSFNQKSIVSHNSE